MKGCRINGYDNYILYENGDIKNIKTGKTLKGSISEHGYKYFRLSQDGKKKSFYQHKLLGEYFLDKPDNFNEERFVINHIDGDKLNNNMENLRKVSLKENSLNAYYNQKTNKSCKPVAQFDLNNNLLNTYPSANEAGRQLQIDSSGISKVCRGIQSTCHGFIFKYVN